MPRLARLRLVSIGHPSARFGDLVLDFRDATGHATDATLWLRNGGGKSSLLNLFFALVRPDRREFLGNRAEAKQRRLEDYVLPRDRGVVIGEWELDGGNGVAEPPHPKGACSPGGSLAYLTGVFYEWGGSAGADAGQLKRLFFAGRTSETFALDTLPLIADAKDGKLVRRNMAAFRQELVALREASPDLALYWTTTNREWTDHLVTVGIDPELFTYQIRMNQREGGADEVFRFADHDQFVDFLLGLALDPALGEGVTANIGTFRQELRDRKDQWIPEIELVAGMIERLTPLVDVKQQRATWLGDIAARGGEFTALTRFFDTRTAALATQLADLDTERTTLETELTAARDAAHRELQTGVALRAFAADARHQQARAETKRARADLDAATQRVRRWEAAVPLWASRRFAASAAGYAAELERKRAQFAPELGELKLAAARFALALRETVQSRRDAVTTDVAAAAAERRRASEQRAAAAEHGAQVSQARERAKNLEERLAELRAARTELETDATLERGETVADAIARHAGTRDRASRDATAAGNRDRELVVHIAACDPDRTAALAEAARSDERARRLADELALGMRARRALEASDDLRRQLETEDVDVLRLPAAIVHQIQDTSRAARDQAIGHRVAQTLDERAIARLESTGLLPPSRDVDAILAVIESRLQSAWSGWTYLEANVPREQRLAYVRAIPSIVDGIVIADADFASAVEHLAAARLELEGPVVLARQSAFVLDAASELVVIGPTLDGRFDRASADAELRARRTRLARVEDAIETTETRAATLQRLAIHLEQFFERFPAGWFVDHEQRIAAERAASTRHTERAAEQTAKIAALGMERTELATRLDQLAAERATATARIARCDSFATRSQREAEWTTDRATAARAADDSRTAAETALAAAEQADAAADTAEKRAAAAREHAAVIEVELGAIDYLGEHTAPVALPVDDLRQDYRRRKAVYEDRVGEDALDQLAAADQAQVATQRARFERIARQYDLDEHDVAALIDDLAEADSPEDHLRDANDARAAANGVLGHRTTFEQRAKEQLDDANRAVAERDAPALVAPPTSADAADADAHAAEQRSHTHTREADRLDDELDRAGRELAALTRTRDLVEEARKRAGSIGAAYGDLLADPTAPADLAIRDDAISATIDAIEAVLRQARTQLNRLDTTRATAVRNVRNFASESRFEQLKSLLAKKLLESEPDDLERLADSHIADLAARRQQLEAQITSIDRHRETLVTEALNAAEEGLALLRSAANQSRLPEHVPGLGGAQFLRITTHSVDDLAERRSRIATLIDEVCDAGQMPSGLVLVQRAVRRLARPIKVYVLHPDPALGRESVEIPEIARCSGGEQLTSAILLYCTLAQVRARARGATRKGTSLLILDNPIGRASRARFLELQREVARTMGVQLVYTTGVNDYDALRALPKIVRLRNQRVDRGSGHQVVELEDAVGIEAIQLGRVET